MKLGETYIRMLLDTLGIDPRRAESVDIKGSNSKYVNTTFLEDNPRNRQERREQQINKPNRTSIHLCVAFHFICITEEMKENRLPTDEQRDNLGCRCESDLATDRTE